MSVREQEEGRTEEQKAPCAGRGSGLAVAAISVGVGAAALYYFFRRNPENPSSGGATTSGWRTQRTAPFSSHAHEDSNEYSTISEHSTTDTSIHESSVVSNNSSSESSIIFYNSNDDDSSSDSESSSSENSSQTSTVNLDSDENVETQIEDTDSETDPIESGEVFSSSSESELIDPTPNDDESLTDVSIESNPNRDNASENVNQNPEENTGYVEYPHLSNRHPTQLSGDLDHEYDSDTTMDWDVTDPSLHIPEIVPQTSYSYVLRRIATILNTNNGTRPTREEIRQTLAQEKLFRERAPIMEECSICFEMMLQTEGLLTLPCTHCFHIMCIGPWLRQKRTCPNCRKTA